MAKKIPCLIFIFLIAVPVLFGEDERIPERRPKVGLVLAGGGALGFAHIGVLKVLEENNIHVDYIAGTSMGGIIGALSAFGYPAKEIEEKVGAVNWADLFLDTKNRSFISYKERGAFSKYFFNMNFDESGFNVKKGLSSGQKILDLFYRLVGPCSEYDDFDDLPTPFRAVSADILTGEPYIFHKGSLADAMRSTMSIPGVFTPVEIEGRMLVDGMVVNNLPVSVAKQMGADIVIAVNLSSMPKTKEELNDPAAIVSQMINLYMDDEIKSELELADIVIAPDLDKYSTGSYFKCAEIIKKGEEAAAGMIGYIKAAVGEKNSEYYKTPSVPVRAEKIVDRTEVEGVDIYEKLVIEKNLKKFINKVPDQELLLNYISKLHSTGRYISIRYYLNEVDGINILKLKITPNETGPFFLRAGFFAENNSNLHEEGIANILLGLELNDLIFDESSLKAEFELFSGFLGDMEYFVPFKKHFFIVPEFAFQWSPDQNEYRDGERFGKGDFKKIRAAVGAGTFISSLGEISLGCMNEYFINDYSEEYPEEDFNGAVRTLFFHSKLDNINSAVMPEYGNFLEIFVKYSGRIFGSEENYLKAKVMMWRYFRFLEKNSIGIRLFGGMDFATALPFYDRLYFRPVNFFPGYSNQELSYSNIAGAMLDYKFNIFSLSLGNDMGKVFLTLRGGAAAAYDKFELFSEKKKEILYGAGAGLGINVFRIPVSMELSLNDDRRLMFHISAGNKF